ncbi:MAG TPA: hypothetical protein VGJ48_21260 [Pyrinomonadaceae bacterium]|jgi:hypothetical protein
MPGWAKALIIVCFVIVLLVVGVIAAGVYWWSHNKDALIARGKAQVTEGRNVGLTTDNQSCVDQSILRYKADPGFARTLAANLFLQSCLEASRPTPNFCDEVPKETDFIKSSQWRLAQCKRVDLSADQYCQQLFAPVQRFCQRPFPKPSTPDEYRR